MEDLFSSAIGLLDERIERKHRCLALALEHRYMYIQLAVHCLLDRVMALALEHVRSLDR